MRNIIGDAIGGVCLFIIIYAAAIIGHGVGY